MSLKTRLKNFFALEFILSSILLAINLIVGIKFLK
jgi:hypothetical protein